MNSLYDPAVLQTSPQAVATDLKKLFVGGIEHLKTVHSQMLGKINSADRNQLDPLLPTLEQDFRALNDFISRFDPQWGTTLPARQAIQATGGETPRPLPDENVHPETLEPVQSTQATADPNRRVEYNDENIPAEEKK